LTESEVEQLGILMEQTKLSYPGQEILKETVEMWAPAWMALAEKFGMAALRRGLQDHMMSSRFFPQPSELRDAIEARKSAPVNVYVPTTRREMARLCGPALTAKSDEMTVEDVERLYGKDSARLYRAKLEAEARA
jgi:hypothetical protein